MDGGGKAGAREEERERARVRQKQVPEHQCLLKVWVKEMLGYAGGGSY